MLATDDDQSGTATTSHNGWAHTATSATTSASSAQPPTADALANAADFLNRELALEGVQRPLVFIGASPDAAADVINTLYSLMQARKRDRAMRAEMMERMHRFESDYDNTMRNVARYKEVIAAKEREVRAGLSEYTKLEREHKNLKSTLKSTADELKLVKATLVQAKNHFMHDKRKWELQADKEKKLKNKMADDQQKLRAVSFRLAHPLPAAPRSASRLGTGSNGEHPTDLYHLQLLHDAEQRERELLSELDAAKRACYEAWCEMQALHAHAVDGLQVVDLPFDLVQETVVHRLREAVLAVRDEWADQHEGAVVVDAAEIEERDAMIGQQQRDLDERDEHLDALSARLVELSQNMKQHSSHLDEWLVPGPSTGPAPPSAASSGAAVLPPAARAQFAGRPLSIMSDAGSDMVRDQMRERFAAKQAALARQSAAAADRARDVLGTPPSFAALSSQQQQQQRSRQQQERTASPTRATSGPTDALGREIADFLRSAPPLTPQSPGLPPPTSASVAARAAAALHPRTSRLAAGGASDAYSPLPEDGNGSGSDEYDADAMDVSEENDRSGGIAYHHQHHQQQQHQLVSPGWFGDVSKIARPPSTPAASAAAAAAANGGVGPGTSGSWTTPLSFPTPGSASHSTPLTARSDGAIAGGATGEYLKPTLRGIAGSLADMAAVAGAAAASAGHNAATPAHGVGPSAGARQVKISPQSVAYRAGSPGPPRTVPTAMGSSGSSATTQYQAQQQQYQQYQPQQQQGSGRW